MTEPRILHPDPPPPASAVGAIGWLRRNLFSSPLNVALTDAGGLPALRHPAAAAALGVPGCHLERRQPRGVSSRGGLLGVHPGSLRAIHVRLLPGRPALAGEGCSSCADPRRRATVRPRRARQAQGPAGTGFAGGLSRHRLRAVQGGDSRSARSGDQSLGRVAAHPGDCRRRHDCRSAAGGAAGAGPTLATAGHPDACA